MYCAHLEPTCRPHPKESRKREQELLISSFKVYLAKLKINLSSINYITKILKNVKEVMPLLNPYVKNEWYDSIL